MPGTSPPLRVTLNGSVLSSRREGRSPTSARSFGMIIWRMPGLQCCSTRPSTLWSSTVGTGTCAQNRQLRSSRAMDSLFSTTLRASGAKREPIRSSSFSTVLGLEGSTITVSVPVVGTWVARRCSFGRGPRCSSTSRPHAGSVRCSMPDVLCEPRCGFRDATRKELGPRQEVNRRGPSSSPAPRPSAGHSGLSVRRARQQAGRSRRRCSLRSPGP